MSQKNNTEQDEKRVALKNTVPCRNFTTTGKCNLIGDGCTYAHSLEDLRELKCLSGNDCQRRNCRHIHPSETRDEWIRRTRYDVLFNNAGKNPEGRRDRESNPQTKGKKITIIYSPDCKDEIGKLGVMANNLGIVNIELVLRKPRFNTRPYKNRENREGRPE